MNSLLLRNVSKLSRCHPTLNSRSRPLFIITRSIHGPKKSEEYNEVAQYPPIRPYRNEDEKGEAELCETMKNLKTVEEKQWYINKPKFYGWYSTVVDIGRIRYGTLDFAQYVTNTTIVDNCLPECYGNVVTKSEEEKVEVLSAIDIEAKKIATEIEPLVKAFLINCTQHWEKKRDIETDKVPFHENGARIGEELGIKKPKRERATFLTTGLNRIILSHLSSKKSHLKNATVDFLPRNEAFWFRGGIHPDARMVKKRLGRVESQKKKGVDEEYRFKDERVYEEYDRAIQLKGDSMIQIRTDKMLPPYIKNVGDDEVCTKGHVPKYNYVPNYTGYVTRFQHGTNLPGHWTGSPSLFGHLSFVSAINDHESVKNSEMWSPDSEYADRPRMLLTKALLSSFAVLLPNACYQGFSPLNDPTHPFCTQTVVTDGQVFKFSVSQLNKTALLNVDTDEKMTTRNVVWHLPEQQLYSSIDENYINGFNSDVLETLVKFYLIEPSVAEGDINNKEYLGEHKYVFNLKNNYNREFFTASHRMVYSNRPRHLPKPDILAYQRIFMINHPEQLFFLGNREQPWFKMKDIDFRGREHWNPEFRSLDHFQRRQVKKFRQNKWEYSQKKAFPPLTDDEA